MTRNSFFRSLPYFPLIVLALLAPRQVFAQAYKVDVGYNRLRNEIGAGLAMAAMLRGLPISEFQEE